MRVYQLETNHDVFQRLLPLKPLKSVPDGRPVKKWKPPAVRLFGGSKPKPDIWALYPIGIALGARARAVAEPLLDGTCELLPFEAEGESLVLLNPLETSTAFRPSTGPLAYEVDPAAVPEATIFRISGVPGAMFTAERTDTPGLRAAILDAGLTGLSFPTVWSDEPGEARRS